MDKEKIEFLELKRRAKTLEKEPLKDDEISNADNSKDISRAQSLKNATNPIMSAFKAFTAAKKFNINHLKDL